MERIPFESIKQQLAQISGIHSWEVLQLTPDSILSWWDSNQVSFHQRPIPGWAGMELGHLDLSATQLWDHTSLDFSVPGKTIMVTDPFFESQHGFLSNNQAVLAFAEDEYSNISGEDFVQSADYIFMQPDQRKISVIHHEGALFEYRS